ncbi:RNA-binding S4 domain-containing protein [Selenomonadales bacterium OttesenSCG-928-I06]|nr:RNA-binding S4 domain-containing protein [Selenomonadales bacterium OttesenSCG-928-I06]
MEIIEIKTPYINVDQLLKFSGLIESNGQVIQLLEEKLILVNDVVISERRKKIYPGDVVKIEGVAVLKVINEV